MPKVKFGQTLFVANVTGPVIAQVSVRSWYNQIMNYDFQRPKINSQNRYFVQLVWRGTTEVGIGKVTEPGPNGMTYIVAFFNPAGDTEDGIQYNVLPVTGKLNEYICIYIYIYIYLYKLNLNLGRKH